MADIYVKGPNNTIIKYEDQLDGTHAEVVSVIGGGSGAGLVDGDYGDITVGGTGTTMTIDNQAVTLAKMANIATDTFIGRDTAGTGVPEALSIATVQAMLGIGSGSSGSVTVYALDGANEAARKPTIAISQSLARAGTFRLTDGFPTRGIGLLIWAAQKVTGGAGTSSVRVHMDATGVALGAGNDIHGTVALSTSANGGAQGMMIFYGNGTDQTSVRVQTPLNQTNPFQTLLTASVFTQTVNTNQDLDVALSLTTDATDTAKIVDAFLVVFDPDGAAGGGSAIAASEEGVSLTSAMTSIDFVGAAVTATNVGGAVTVTVTATGNTPIDEAAGRALVSADNGKTFRYTGAGAANFTIATGQSFPEGLTIIWGAAGRPTIVCASGVTLDGVDAGTVTPAAQYNRMAIQTVAVNTNVVVQ
jgi:hypothetical protein